VPLIRSSKRSDHDRPSGLAAGLSALLVAGVMSAGCGSGTPPMFPSTDRWPERRREPDGVAVDPTPAAVGGVSRGDTSSGGEVALAPPLGPAAALASVGQLFEAASREDMQRLTALFAQRGGFMNPSSGSRSVTLATVAFRERFRKLDYRQLAGQTIYRESDAEVYTYDDLERPPPGRPSRPPEMAQGDALIKVRVLTPRIGPDRLFGDEIVFLLRPDAGRYRIQFMAEEFQLPLPP
jgi:hypothetical protein